MYMNFTRIYERASGNNVKKKQKNTTTPASTFAHLLLRPWAYPPARRGRCVYTYMCVHIIRPQAQNTSRVCSGKGRDPHTSSAEYETKRPAPRLPQAGMPETKGQEAPERDTPTQSSRGRLYNFTRITGPLTLKYQKQVP